MLDFSLILILALLATIPISLVYLLVSHTLLKKRVAVLEAKLRSQSAPDTDHASPPAQIQEPPKPSPQTDEPRLTPPADSPWDRPKAQPEAIRKPDPIQTDDGPPKAVVLTRERVQALINWLTQNWFYAVSAGSLVLAGVYLVLYSMEQGLLPPYIRVLAAFGFGLALIALGEYIRRRSGDHESSSTAYLPSTFSGAGIVTLFGAVLSARLLYDFIGPEIALAAMAVIGLGAMVLGWLYGPLLAAIGVLGAMIAPFVIGGSSDDPSLILAYFAIISIMGMAIDTLRRWAWVSALSLVLGFGAGVMVLLGMDFSHLPQFAAYFLTLTWAGIAIPVRKLQPDHSGTMLSLRFLAPHRNQHWPEFPTRLAGGSVAATSLILLWAGLVAGREAEFWVVTAAFSALILALLILARNAPALADLVSLPGIALAVHVASSDYVWRAYQNLPRTAEDDLPRAASFVVAIGLILSATAAWRSLQNGPSRLFFALFAVLLAPTLAIGVELRWHPAPLLGSFNWALHAMAIAALMVVLAERFARADGPDSRERSSLAILSALACVTFGLVILFTSAALTTAIAATIVAAAWLDWRFKMPLMGLYILAGIATVGYRLVVDPGLFWAVEAPAWEMLLSNAGAVAAFVLSFLLAQATPRPKTKALLESAIVSSTGILVSVLLYRAIQTWGGDPALDSHWGLSLMASVWLSMAFAQVYRLQLGGALLSLRQAFATVFALLAAGNLALAVFAKNPLFDGNTPSVIGPSVFNSLIPAYLLPAALLAFGAWWLRALPKHARQFLAALSLALAGMWLGLTIRHFWRGAEGMALPGFDQAELYSYTVTLLVIGAGLFYQSLARQSALLRKAGLIFIGLAVIKVFAIDIRGLGGLIRVFSLLLLGFSLAGLAWLNRWALARSANDTGKDD